MVAGGHPSNKTVEVLFFVVKKITIWFVAQDIISEKLFLAKVMKLFKIIDGNGFPGKLLNDSFSWILKCLSSHNLRNIKHGHIQNMCASSSGTINNEVDIKKKLPAKKNQLEKLTKIIAELMKISSGNHTEEKLKTGKEKV